MSDVFIFICYILLKHLPGIDCTIHYPCPDISPTTKEEVEDGSDSRDSVLIRVRPLKEECNCLVTLDYQVTSTILYVKRYDKETVTDAGECGPDVYFLYSENNTVQTLFTMTCTNSQDLKLVTLSKNSFINVVSNATGGTFSTGFCIEIQRAISHEPNLALRVVCGAPGEVPSTLQPLPTFSSERSTMGSDGRTGVTNSDQKMYIAIGASIGAFAVLVVIVTIIFCKRRFSKQETRQEQREPYHVPNIQSNDPEYDGLKYNLLYVQTDQRENLEVDYSTVDLEKPHTVQQEGNCNDTDDIHGNAKEVKKDTYAVVDKPKKKDNLENQTYAAVDKSKKQRSAGVNTSPEQDYINAAFPKE